MMVEIIEKVRRKETLTKKEIQDFLTGYLKGEVKDYQMSAFLMAICLNGLSLEEVLAFVECYIQSGKQLSFAQEDCLVDKHSTGGVGDKTTLIVVPIVAALGVPVIKMSGRGLGLTGGTIDKLESIPGYQVERSLEEIRKQVKDIGMVVCSATEDIAPLDKKTYALRDVTGTVSSIPLIAISIMSKKIAGGAKKFVFDMKYGEGALLETKEEVVALADLIKKIAEHYHCKAEFVYSDMSKPLGYTVGNRLEVYEAMAVLKDNLKGELYDKCVHLASHMVALSKKISLEEAIKEVIEVLENKKAWEKFQAWIAYQKGDLEKMELAIEPIPYLAHKEGTLQKIHAKEIAMLAKQLGAGRDSLEDEINPSSGVVLLKKEGDFVKKNEKIAYLYTEKQTIPNMDSCFEIL